MKYYASYYPYSKYTLVTRVGSLYVSYATWMVIADNEDSFLDVLNFSLDFARDFARGLHFMGTT